MIATAVEAELAGYLAQFTDVRTEAGDAAVVRNGIIRPAIPNRYKPCERADTKGALHGSTPVIFRSALVPPYVRRPKTLEAALPWLYLKGISSGELGAGPQISSRPRCRWPISENGLMP